ncbi:hypothetical protein IFM89_029837 [Coptis chinensis]|uniref:Uncharacterized protein n=1 Tax=Coptis chinensis TaxID=261450 RepID=A0A835HQT6_9MAGN|nr:hypothetical protein IFM89_029837 [Coptis chinensis]
MSGDVEPHPSICVRAQCREVTITYFSCYALQVVPQPPTVKKSRTDDEEFGLVVRKRVRFLEKTLEFKDMKDLDSFTIGVNSLTIDSEFSKNDREKYYELCCSQDTFLHDNL